MKSISLVLKCNRTLRNINFVLRGTQKCSVEYNMGKVFTLLRSDYDTEYIYIYIICNYIKSCILKWMNN